MTPYSFNDKKQRMARRRFVVKTTRRRQDSRRRNPAGLKGIRRFVTPTPNRRGCKSNCETYRNRLESIGTDRNLPAATGTLNATQTL